LRLTARQREQATVEDLGDTAKFLTCCKHRLRGFELGKSRLTTRTQMASYMESRDD